MWLDIRRFDVYRKIPKDLTQPTYTGAFISLCSSVFIIYLFISELISFMTPTVTVDVYVDDPAKSYEKVPIQVNLTLFRMECQYAGIDIQDATGRHEVGFSHNTKKIPIDEDSGCRLEGNFTIAKVPGNFHISTHAAANQPTVYDFSHRIHNIRIGSPTTPDILKQLGVSASFEPLRDQEKNPSKEMDNHEYFVRVVPTVVEDETGAVTKRYYPYQFLAMHRSFSSLDMFGNPSAPAVYFRYDMMPMTVKYLIKRKPFYHFLTNVCAIVGGTFTVAGIIDACIFSASEIVKKAQMGKLH